MLLLTACDKNMVDQYGVKWPRSGEVSIDNQEAGVRDSEVLVGLPWGEGDVGILSNAPYAIGVVFEALDDEVIGIGAGWAQCQRARVLFVGLLPEVATQLAKLCPGRIVHYASVAKSDDTLAVVGHGGSARSGFQGRAVSGNRGRSIVDDFGIAVSGDWGSSIACERGVAISCLRGSSNADTNGIAIAGQCGRASSQDAGLSSVDFDGEACSGDGGVISILWYDGDKPRRRCAEVGEGGLKPNTLYRLNERGEFVEVME